MTTTQNDRRPEYINEFHNATPAVQAMVPAGLTRPVICLACNAITEYDDKTTVVIYRRKRDGYVCGATCATHIINTNTPNNKFTFITVDREMKVAGRMAV